MPDIPGDPNLPPGTTVRDTYSLTLVAPCEICGEAEADDDCDGCGIPGCHECVRDGLCPNCREESGE